MTEMKQAAPCEGGPLSEVTAKCPPDSKSTNAVNADFVLTELRCASLRCRLWAADLDSIGVALKGGWISPEQAVEQLDPDARAFLGMREGGIP